MIKTTPPPNWEYLRRKFGVEWKGIVVTYGGVIYSPNPVVGDTLVHEEVHVKQQAGWDADKYVELYMNDPFFRYEMELEAYRAQYKHSPHKLKELAAYLSGPMYGRIASYEQALKDIQA